MKPKSEIHDACKLEFVSKARMWAFLIPLIMLSGGFVLYGFGASKNAENERQGMQIEIVSMKKDLEYIKDGIDRIEARIERLRRAIHPALSETLFNDVE